MTPDELARSLKSGRGNAVLYLQTHDAAPYRDVILNACLHCVDYDPHMNGDRARYLFEIIQLTGDVPFYRTHIFAALSSPPNRDYDKSQLFHLVGCFAAQGDEEARSLLYSSYTANLTDPEHAIGSDAIIELDGVQGFLFVATVLGKVLTATATADDDIDEMPVYDLKERVPDADLTTIRAQAERIQPHAVAYIERMQALSEERKWNQQGQSASGTIVSSFDELESLFTTEVGKRHSSKLVQWGRRAPEEDRRRAAEALSAETNPARQIAYAGLFRYVPFPLDPAKLIEMADSGNEAVMLAGVNAIGTMQHPDIRALALRLLAIPQWGYHAGEMLIANHEDGDERLIEAALVARLSDEDLFHDLGLRARKIFKEHPKPENVSALALMYEHGLCSQCRDSYVALLIALGAFPEWMIAECLHDGLPKVREQTREYLATRSA